MLSSESCWRLPGYSGLDLFLYSGCGCYCVRWFLTVTRTRRSSRSPTWHRRLRARRSKARRIVKDNRKKGSYGEGRLHAKVRRAIQLLTEHHSGPVYRELKMYQWKNRTTQWGGWSPQLPKNQRKKGKDDKNKDKNESVAKSYDSLPSGAAASSSDGQSMEMCFMKEFLTFMKETKTEVPERFQKFLPSDHMSEIKCQQKKLNKQRNLAQKIENKRKALEKDGEQWNQWLVQMREEIATNKEKHVTNQERLTKELNELLAEQKRLSESEDVEMNGKEENADAEEYLDALLAEGEETKPSQKPDLNKALEDMQQKARGGEAEDEAGVGKGDQREDHCRREEARGGRSLRPRRERGDRSDRFEGGLWSYGLDTKPTSLWCAEDEAQQWQLAIWSGSQTQGEGCKGPGDHGRDHPEDAEDGRGSRYRTGMNHGEGEDYGTESRAREPFRRRRSYSADLHDKLTSMVYILVFDIVIFLAVVFYMIFFNSGQKMNAKKVGGHLFFFRPRTINKEEGARKRKTLFILVLLFQPQCSICGSIPSLESSNQGSESMSMDQNGQWHRQNEAFGNDLVSFLARSEISPQILPEVEVAENEEDPQSAFLFPLGADPIPARVEWSDYWALHRSIASYCNWNEEDLIAFQSHLLTLKPWTCMCWYHKESTIWDKVTSRWWL